MRVLVTVKAYPSVGRASGREAVCVAGVRLDGPGAPAWVRLWPVEFRELPNAQKFKKWQEIEVETTRPTGDQRPESWTPRLDNLTMLGRVIGSEYGWRNRWEALGSLVGATTLCELMAGQRADTRSAPSLGLVRVVEARVSVEPGPPWEADRQAAAEFAAQPHLFREEALEVLQPPPYRIRYEWLCASPHCGGHSHLSCDWEAGQAARQFVRTYGAEAPTHLAHNFGERMIEGKDLHFFVGNQHQRPDKFLVLGSFYPPQGSQPAPTLI
jgi:hypothetical protein